MEGSSTIMMENLRANETNASSKTLEASLKIDSIAIELMTTNGMEVSEKCEHFSIRGFVSEIRKEDWKKCWPFASDGDSNYNFEEQTCVLPPLRVPKFRFWQCQSCLQDIGCKANGKYDKSPLKCCKCGSKSNCNVSNAQALFLASTPPVDGQLASKADTPVKRNDDASVYFNKTVEDHPRWYKDKRKKTNITTTAAISKLKCNASSEPHRLEFGQDDVSSAEFVKIRKISNKSSCRQLVTTTEIGEDNQNKEETAREITEKADNVRGVQHPSAELDYASSESSDTIIGKDHRNPEHDSSGSSLRKKTRKMRLLTDLLRENGDLHNSNVRNVDPSLVSVPDASARIDKPSVSETDCGASGIGGKGSGLKRKRKLSLDKERRPQETTSPGKVSQEVGILKRDVEMTDAVAGSESQENTSERLNPQTGSKSNGTKSKVGKSPSVIKKKKKTLIVDGCPSTSPTQETVPDKMWIGVADSSKGNFAADNVPSKSVPDAPVAKEINLFPLTTSKKEEKMPLIGTQLPIRPHTQGASGGAPEITRKDAKILHNAPTGFKSYAAQDISSERGLNLCLNSYMSTQRNDNEHILRAEGRQTSTLTWQEHLQQDPIVRKPAANQFVGNFSIETPDISFGKSLNYDFSNKREISFLQDKLKYTSNLDVGGSSFLQQKEFFATRNSERSSEIQEHSAAKKKDSDRRSDKGSEQGTSDDIPMEIVELMAKNQYERCLPDSEYDSHRQKANDTRISPSIDSSSVYRHGGLSLFQRQTPQRLKTPLQNGRNGIIKSRENLGLNKQDYISHAGQNQFTVSQLERTQSPVGLGHLLHHQEKPPTLIQHSDPCFGRQNINSEKLKWVGDIGGRKPSPPNFSGPCNTCASTSKQGKESNDNPWSRVIPNQIPFFHVLAPKCPPPSASLGPKSHFPATSMHKESMNHVPDLPFPDLKKQNRNFGSDPFTRTSTEFPFSRKHNGIEIYQKPTASLDLYSNDTIPAMHLLSLMDAGLRASNTPINPSNPFKRSSAIFHNQDHNEMSRMHFEAPKAANNGRSAPYGFQGKVQVPHSSGEHVQAIPQTSAGPSIGSFKPDKFFNKAASFAPQFSREIQKRKGSDSLGLGEACRPQKTQPKSGGIGTNFGSSAVHNMQTMFFGDSRPMWFPFEYRAPENSTRNKLDVPNATMTFQAHQSGFKDEICSINRNPADFTIPQPGNVYMIAGEDLKFTRGIMYPKGPQLIKLGGRKRQRKPQAQKENARHIVQSIV